VCGVLHDALTLQPSSAALDGRHPFNKCTSPLGVLRPPAPWTRGCSVGRGGHRAWQRCARAVSARPSPPRTLSARAGRARRTGARRAVTVRARVVPIRTASNTRPLTCTTSPSARPPCEPTARATAQPPGVKCWRDRVEACVFSWDTRARVADMRGRRGRHASWRLNDAFGWVRSTRP
jgi:hypothetical protein